MAAQNATPAQLVAIREAHEGMSLTDAPGRHDREFHGAIAAACGNAALAATVAHLWNLTLSSSVYRRMQDYFVDAKVWATAHAEHQRILTALLARDPIRARHAMHAHLLGILARLREDFGDAPGRIPPDT
ncbi:putative L-lactate dehydrogenase operon regulatory protein [compost metagenome]